MLLGLFDGIYQYFFPEPAPVNPKKEYEERYMQVESELSKSMVLLSPVIPTDEEIGIEKAKKLNMLPIMYQFAFMTNCNACHKVRFPENVSQFTDEKANKKIYKEFHYLEACKDDDNCLKIVRERAKIAPS